jgi:hypothetical protein
MFSSSPDTSWTSEGQDKDFPLCIPSNKAFLKFCGFEDLPCLRQESMLIALSATLDSLDSLITLRGKTLLAHRHYFRRRRLVRQYRRPVVSFRIRLV